MRSLTSRALPLIGAAIQHFDLLIDGAACCLAAHHRIAQIERVVFTAVCHEVDLFLMVISSRRCRYVGL